AWDSVTRSSPSCLTFSIARIGEKNSTAQPLPSSTRVERILTQMVRRRLALRCSALGGGTKTVSSRSPSLDRGLFSGAFEVLVVSSSVLGIPVSVTVFLSQWTGRSTEIDFAGFLAARPGNFFATWSAFSELLDRSCGGFFDISTRY